MTEDLESSILMENIELRKMAAEIDSTPEKYISKEPEDDLPFRKSKVSESTTPKNDKNKVIARLINQRKRYFPSYHKTENASAEEKISDRTQKSISGLSNSTQETKPRSLSSSSVSELILSIHRNPEEYFTSDFDSRCSVENEVVYRETTAPLKKKTLKKRVNRFFQSCMCGSDRHYTNFGDMYERRNT